MALRPTTFSQAGQNPTCVSSFHVRQAACPPTARPRCCGRHESEGHCPCLASSSTGPVLSQLCLGFQNQRDGCPGVHGNSEQEGTGDSRSGARAFLHLPAEGGGCGGCACHKGTAPATPTSPRAMREGPCFVPAISREDPSDPMCPLRTPESSDTEVDSCGTTELESDDEMPAAPAAGTPSVLITLAK